MLITKNTTQQNYLISMGACWKSSVVKQHEIPPPSAWISDCWIWDLYISYSLWLGSCIGILVIQYKYIHVHPAIAYMYVYYIYYMYICENCIQPFFPTSQAIQPITPAVAIVHESSVICKARQKRSKATVTRWESCSNSTKPEGPLGWPRSVPRSTKVSPLVGLISFFQKKNMKPPWKRNL